MSNIIDTLKPLIRNASMTPWQADIDDRGTKNAFWTGKFYVGYLDTWEVNENSQKTIQNVLLIESVISMLPEILREINEQEKKLSSIFNTLVG